MKTHLEGISKHSVWLRLGLVAFVLLGVITLLLVINSEPVEAAPEVTLHGGDVLFVTPEGCNLQVLKKTQFRAKLGCEAFTPTDTTESDPVAGQNDENVPEKKIYQSIKPGKKLIVLATTTECKLKVAEETPSFIRIKCKRLPATPTPTATNTRINTPTPTKTRGPAMTNLWVGNYTTATLCFEVYGTGIGSQCWIGITPKEIGSFPAGVYTYTAQAWCGSRTDTVDFPPTKVTLNFACSSGILVKVGEISPERSASDAFATPAR